ncbi:hypothetical protein SAMN05444365_101680 [Micromonospora pattaloongensis]|uniref:Uncharacterized protein n=1 Tax=Micromonospora pattaloongensis TaxID=405436 RepID=A0A1H3H6J6_9ACTN|nr:hypothetical protein [Micromonospora pattaloongensis]SDY10384.1 hypothetical protein SAMN05444365_101680 [Micromonospora pattaloongensis]
MDDTEDLLRATLHDRSAQIVAAPLLDPVRRRADRQRRRGHVVATGLAAAAVLLGGPALLTVVTPDAVPDIAAVPADPPDPRTPVRLGPAASPLPTFPFAPRVRPDGYGRPVAQIAAGEVILRYSGAAGRWLTVTAGTVEPPVLDPGPVASVRVHGRQAALRAASGASPASSVRWRESSGLWVEVRADAGLKTKELIRYAEGLRPGAVAVAVPCSFARVPLDMPLDVVTPTAMSFRPAALPPSDDFVGKLTVLLSAPGEQPPADARPVTVGGRPGWITTGPDATSLAVDLDDRVLVVQVGAGLRLSDGELVSFAAGISLTRHAEVGVG